MSFKIFWFMLDLVGHLMSKADEGQENEGIDFYIFDSHRPLNLANVWRAKSVYVFVEVDTFPSVLLITELGNVSRTRRGV